MTLGMLAIVIAAALLKLWRFLTWPVRTLLSLWRGPGAHCDYCGSLDWTIQKYGRVTHKRECPRRQDGWHQGNPTG